MDPEQPGRSIAPRRAAADPHLSLAAWWLEAHAHGSLLRSARAERHGRASGAGAENLRVYDITAHGALSDSNHPNTAAIQAAMDAAAAAGGACIARATRAASSQQHRSAEHGASDASAGGTVRVPRGLWVTGPLQLRSGVRLLLESRDAVLKAATQNLSDWPTLPWQARSAVAHRVVDATRRDETRARAGVAAGARVRAHRTLRAPSACAKRHRRVNRGTGRHRRRRRNLARLRRRTCCRRRRQSPSRFVP